MFISITNYESLINSIIITLLASIILGSLLFILFKPVNAILIITGLTSSIVNRGLLYEIQVNADISLRI